MSDQVPARATQPGEAPTALRVLALVAVVVGVAALAGAAGVLSYSGIHAVALQAGITPRLARGYPLIFDAMLVVILAALLSLRGAGLPSRILAWFSLLALLAAAAGADALHAAGHKLPSGSAAVTAAVLPWFLVLVGFALLMLMLRHARLRRAAAAQGLSQAHGEQRAHWRPQNQPPPPAQSIVPGFRAAPAPPVPTQPSAFLPPGPVLAVPRQVDPAEATDADQITGNGLAAPAELESDSDATAEPELGVNGALPADDHLAADSELAIDAEMAPDDPSSDETAVDDADDAALEPANGAMPYPVETYPLAGAGDGGGDGTTTSVGALSPAPIAAGADVGDPDMPVFHRVWSSPTPPADQ